MLAALSGHNSTRLNTIGKGKTEMTRGCLNEEVQKIAKAFLKREITTTELRLYPYLDYLMKNEQRIDPRRVNQEDREILQTLRTEGHIEGGASGLSMTKEFYDYINQVLWYSYVVGAYDPVKDALGIS